MPTHTAKKRAKNKARASQRKKINVAKKKK